MIKGGYRKREVGGEVGDYGSREPRFRVTTVTQKGEGERKIRNTLMGGTLDQAGQMRYEKKSRADVHVSYGLAAADKGTLSSIEHCRGPRNYNNQQQQGVGLQPGLRPFVSQKPVGQERRPKIHIIIIRTLHIVT